jgi:hypothetical protein
MQLYHGPIRGQLGNPSARRGSRGIVMRACAWWRRFRMSAAASRERADKGGRDDCFG